MKNHKIALAGCRINFLRQRRTRDVPSRGFNRRKCFESEHGRIIATSKCAPVSQINASENLRASNFSEMQLRIGISIL